MYYSGNPSKANVSASVREQHFNFWSFCKHFKNGLCFYKTQKISLEKKEPSIHGVLEMQSPWCITNLLHRELRSKHSLEWWIVTAQRSQPGHLQETLTVQLEKMQPKGKERAGLTSTFLVQGVFVTIAT